MSGGVGYGQESVPVTVADGEFIRVAPDTWSFEGADSHARFIPFGSNLVLSSKEDLNLFGPRYASERLESVLAACEKLHITLLKVFLPIAQVLPDPQVPGEVRIAPGYLDNLENFLGLCRNHHIRAVVSLTCWGGNGIRWWQDGGQYFGRKPWKTDGGIDSLDVLTRFWTELAGRFKDNPTIFAYTPTVEWTFPATNLTWIPPQGYSPVLPNETGQWYWRYWAAEKYKTVESLNAAWDAHYGSFEDITLPDYGYDGAAHRYVDHEQKIFDYQNFREWTTLRYLTPQLAAIRAAAPNHMVTISNHMRFWDLWEGAAQHFLGTTPCEQKPYIDYVTFHANYHENEKVPDRTDADMVHQTQVLARFVAAGKPMPIILEEFTYTSRDPKRVAEMQQALLEGTVGHVSGWLNWYLMYPADPAEGADSTDPEAQSGWMTPDLEPTPWGLAARTLYEKLQAQDLHRIPPKSVVTLDRRTELIPKGPTQVTRHYRDFDPAAHPIDYVIQPAK
jgi:hypothetical protein